MTPRPKARPVQKKILVVDDEKAMLRQISVLLEGLGYRPVTARNALEGMRLVGMDEPDLVILDIRMPRLDGFEFLRSLRESPKTKQLPVIIVSALSNPESRLKASEMGVVKYLVKPYEAEELIGAVKSLIGGHNTN